MKKITVNKTRILTAAAALVAVFSLAGCGSTAVKEVPQPAETSRSEEATLETAAPEATATPAPTPDVVVPTSVTLEQEGGILNNGMTWTLHATVLPEDAADKTITWTSADESVATIDDSGVITPMHPGRPQSRRPARRAACPPPTTSLCRRSSSAAIAAARGIRPIPAP